MMIQKRSWQEFQAAGLLWWINRGLHLFGWAIVFDRDGDQLDVYPARVKFRGFGIECEDRGFRNLSEYLAREGERLRAETE